VVVSPFFRRLKERLSSGVDTGLLRGGGWEGEDQALSGCPCIRSCLANSASARSCFSFAVVAPAAAPAESIFLDTSSEIVQRRHQAAKRGSNDASRCTLQDADAGAAEGWSSK
jgi:hypothetical protein